MPRFMYLINFFDSKSGVKIVEKICPVYINYLLLLMALFFLHLPIINADTDTWYHLAGGRQMFISGEIPHTSFPSFLEPIRSSVNYYWLFQALIYKLYTIFDFYGLIFLRALLYLSTVTIVFRFLLQGQKNIWALLVGILCSLILINRFVMVRPHLFSYFFLVVFLDAVTSGRSYLKLLPVLAILWVNLHGVEYPVMMLILIVEMGRVFSRRFVSSSPLKGRSLSRAVALVFSMWAICFSPFGFELLYVPFLSTDYASLYMAELHGIDLNELMTLQLFPVNFSTLFAVFFFFSGFSAIFSLHEKKYRQLMLYGGGLFLLTKGNRFIVEFVLLSLPVARTGADFLSGRFNMSTHFYFRAGVAIFFVTAPAFYLHQLFANRDHYPVSQSGIPVGVVHFLKHVCASGNILNFPTTGGYIQWELYPEYKIAMDMKVPHLYSDEDYFEVRNSFFDAECFRKFSSSYILSFVSAPLENPTFRQKVINDFSEFVPIFFDDTEILFVNQEMHPDIAEKYRFTLLYPDRLERMNFAGLKQEEKTTLIEEIERYRAIYPHSRLVNWARASLHNLDGEYEKGISYGRQIIADYPQQPTGYSIVGDAMAGQGKYHEAWQYYQEAQQRTAIESQYEIQMKIWFCLTRVERYKDAYELLKESINIFSPNTTYHDLYRLSVTALQAGRVDEAVRVANFALCKLPSNETVWKRRIGELLDRLH